MILSGRYTSDVRWCHSSVVRLWCETFINWRCDSNRQPYDHSSTPPNFNHFCASSRPKPGNRYQSDSHPVFPRNVPAKIYFRESGTTSITRHWWGRVTCPPALGTCVSSALTVLPLRFRILTRTSYPRMSPFSHRTKKSVPCL